jgi:hypothetical protein
MVIKVNGNRGLLHRGYSFKSHFINTLNGKKAKKKKIRKNHKDKLM